MRVELGEAMLMGSRDMVESIMGGEVVEGGDGRVGLDGEVAVEATSGGSAGGGKGGR